MTGGVGILAIFLPFAWSTSPLAAVFDEYLWRLAWPFFLPALVTSASLHWLITKRLSRSGNTIAYLISAAMICLMLSVYGAADRWPGEFKEWLAFVLPFVTMGFGVFALLKTRLNATLRLFGPTISLQVAYLANCLLCLSSWFGQWQIGAYCSLVTAIAYVIQIILLWRNDEPRISVPAH